MKFYSLLEQHNDGHWWYHGNKVTFASFLDARDYMKRWIWWDEKRNKQIIGHDEPLPDKTLYTRDFTDFRDLYSTDIITVKCEQL